MGTGAGAVGLGMQGGGTCPTHSVSHFTPEETRMVLHLKRTTETVLCLPYSELQEERGHFPRQSPELELHGTPG